MVNTLPKSVKVDRRTYKIIRRRPRPRSPGADFVSGMTRGRVEFDRRVISISPDETRDNDKETLVHEILHAIWHRANLPGKGEERIVGTLAPWLVQVIRDNPRLLAYLTS